LDEYKEDTYSGLGSKSMEFIVPAAEDNEDEKDAWTVVVPTPRKDAIMKGLQLLQEEGEESSYESEEEESHSVPTQLRVSKAPQQQQEDRVELNDIESDASSFSAVEAVAVGEVCKPKFSSC